MSGVIPWEEPLPWEHSRNDSCKGYSYQTWESTEYDCEYEFSGEVTCDDCIFGPYKGNQDPRIDPNIEEDAE